jgi:hypothetical protein
MDAKVIPPWKEAVSANFRTSVRKNELVRGREKK